MRPVASFYRSVGYSTTHSQLGRLDLKVEGDRGHACSHSLEPHYHISWKSAEI
jgi:hypothetical protein